MLIDGLMIEDLLMIGVVRAIQAAINLQLKICQSSINPAIFNPKIINSVISLQHPSSNVAQAAGGESRIGQRGDGAVHALGGKAPRRVEAI